MNSVIRYSFPNHFIFYDFQKIMNDLVDASAVIEALRNIPYQKNWVDKLQEMELKREVAGTSQIEGADFTERELDEALKESPEELITRSQRQAHAAVKTYRWIATIPVDRPIDLNLLKEIHRYIVTGADDDHCAPGQLRAEGQNVIFGRPRHRGTEGGEECERAIDNLLKSVNANYLSHNPIVQAFAVHYHFAAIHPFLDGNGRTARALEALMLQRAGLKDICFISMSNYYYDEKTEYLSTLSETQQANHDLTGFLKFALKGLTIQVRRVMSEIKRQNSKALFKDMMYDLFGRLETKKKKVIGDRQMKILLHLLNKDSLVISELYNLNKDLYKELKNPFKAMVRDVEGLIALGAIKFNTEENEVVDVEINPNWPTEITETEFFKRLKALPKARSIKYLKD